MDQVEVSADYLDVKSRWFTVGFLEEILHGHFVFSHYCMEYNWFSSLYAIAFANLEQGRTATPSVSETISEV